MATETETKEPVVFLLPDGTEVSNDPRFYEEKMRQQILEQQRELLTKSTENTGRATGPSPRGGDVSTFSGRDIQDPDGARQAAKEESEEGSDEEQGDQYDDMTVEELKAEAEARNIDISGVRKKSELKDRLRDYDASQG